MNLQPGNEEGGRGEGDWLISDWWRGTDEKLKVKK
jgi:hypothetical protein